MYCPLPEPTEQKSDPPSFCKVDVVCLQWMFSDHELIERIESGERDRIEFTAAAHDLGKVREAICAFANDLPDHRTAGVIFIGLNDDGSCAGLNIDDELLKTLSGLRSEGKLLPFPVMSVDRRTLRGCAVAVVQVEPTVNPPVRLDGRCWVRIGPRRAQATAEEERRLVEKRRYKNLPYDMQPVDGSRVATDLDMPGAWRGYLQAAVSPEVLEENERSPEEQMRALRLASSDGTPTVTGLLMLGKDTRYWFPGAYIQFVRYRGTSADAPIVSQQEINGTLAEQAGQVEELLKLNISIGLDTEPTVHAEEADYPLQALRELVRNALIHRNYENTNTPVRISWFADRVEIISPGSVYGSVTQANFGTPGSIDYRNPTIAEAMKSMGFMQRFGRGIPIARQALEGNGNPPPEFGVQPTLVSVTLRAAGPHR